MVRHLHKVLPAETWRRLMSMCTRTYRYTPLAMAVSTGDADMLKLLLELLPDTDILDIKDACCNHVLHISARNGYAEVTNLLLEELVKRDHLSVLQNEDGSGLLPLEIARQMAVGRFFKYGINTCIRDEKEQEKEAKERAERLAKGESSWAKHTDVNKVLALIQTASANLSTPLPRHTIQLKELHQMVFEAAKDAHRLAKIPYYRRDSMSNPNSPPDDSSRNVGTQF
jgi:ankyrin repeat protein